MFRPFALASLVIVAMTALACTSKAERPPPATGTVVFVCEHGNVKSLMAASYFNDLAPKSGLQIRAVSRGVALDSNTVPAPIVAGLKDDGFDVAEFSPTALSRADVAASQRVIAINTTVPADADAGSRAVESWNDVPAASADYAAARDSLKAHVSRLISQLKAAETH